MWDTTTKDLISVQSTSLSGAITRLIDVGKNVFVGGTDNSMLIIWKLPEKSYEILPKKEGKKMFEFREDTTSDIIYRESIRK